MIGLKFPATKRKNLQISIFNGKSLHNFLCLMFVDKFHIFYYLRDLVWLDDLVGVTFNLTYSSVKRQENSLLSANWDNCLKLLCLEMLFSFICCKRWTLNRAQNPPILLITLSQNDSTFSLGIEHNVKVKCESSLSRYLSLHIKNSHIRWRRSRQHAALMSPTVMTLRLVNSRNHTKFLSTLTSHSLFICTTYKLWTSH